MQQEVNIQKSEKIAPPASKEYLSINEVCGLLSISRSQFWRLRKEGKFPRPTIENPARWKRSDFDRAA
jgi:predicted DNA-binding transcriptional regulator AlpA